ncbi:methyl-accepting chemotaxis protein [Vibrio cincinnatiensis]|uniref:methyl-accepting chemotaxis protein n=1 Tax=Vibrio cincinnatiensis TaxID=675 RepID=UPI001EE089BC|nr:methyl-accepting chemotaxis protein [Vibrio cincinnatiensis]MCG3737096.1 methyl-accepting chemotaxis protein [Vibrio cincinnatiensis]MCG3747073.1 methyl-accepting chemotaxis protein [Vibrio cincinnatiensis]
MDIRPLLNNISVRNQIIAPVLFSVLILFTVLMFVRHALEASDKRLISSVNTLVIQKDTLADIDDLFYPLRIDVAYGQIDSSKNDVIIKKINNDFLTITQRLNSTFSAPHYANDLQNIFDAMGAYTEKATFSLNAARQAEGTHVDEKQLTLLSEELRIAGDRLVQAFNQLSEDINQSALQTIVDLDAESTQTLNHGIIIILIALALAAIFAWFVAGIIAKPAQMIQQAMQEVSEGNLSIRIETSGKNELASLSQDINATIERLQHTLRDLNMISDQVASSSQELASVMVQSENNSQQEILAVESVATAATELESMAKSMSESAASADELTRNAGKKVEISLEIFEENQQDNEKITQVLHDAAAIIQELQEQSTQINNVVEMISNVSEQTNLLALNAAIEAARAGEAGRGFAVVADEVRVLAVNTQKSTRDIKTIIEQLQNKSLQANQNMQTSIQLLENNDKLSEKANLAMQEIIQVMTLINDTNTQVAVGAEEQANVTSEISKNMMNISDIVQQNFVGLSQCSSASNELSHLANDQKDKIAFFKI